MQPVGVPFLGFGLDVFFICMAAKSIPDHLVRLQMFQCLLKRSWKGIYVKLLQPAVIEMIKILLNRGRRLHVVLDTVQPCLEHHCKCKIEVAARVRASELASCRLAFSF